jgi:hypothetical protein
MHGGSMKSVTPTQLRADIYNLLDEVLETGIPLEIKKGDKKLKIVSLETVDKFQNLVSRPDVVKGDPEELVEISWENKVKLDLP